MREIAFDTETTGLSWKGDDRVIEVGAVEMINYIPTGKTFRMLINPGRSVSADTVRITGITDDDLVGMPRFEHPDVVDGLLEFFGEAQIIAHNAGFDRGFLNAELKRCGREPIPVERWIDTVMMARKKFPGAPASLDALCKRFDISLGARTLHGALLDAELLASVYLELMGGRARAFDFDELGGKTATGERPPARQRPKPLTSLITDEERQAHEAMVERLGEDALWRKA
ncbi:MAG: DNA polymerase III subunit epsilon [Hyphomonadaceae bacterium]